MDWQPEKPDGDPDFLDRLLAEAQWAEPTPEVIDRLRGHWRSLMVRRTRRRRLAWMLMAASILLAAVGLTSWLRSEHGAIQPRATDMAEKKALPSLPQPIQQPVHAAKQPPSRSLVQKRMPANSPAARTSRPPNAYERVVLVAHRRARDSRSQYTEAKPVEPPVQQVAEQPTGDRQDALRQQLLLLLAQNDLPSVRASWSVSKTIARRPPRWIVWHSHQPPPWSCCFHASAVRPSANARPRRWPWDD